MIQRSPSVRPHAFLLFGALALTALGGSSCVTPEEHQKTKDWAKHYEQRMNDLELENEKLSRDNERLENELLMGEVSALDAGFDSDFDARIAEYERKLGELSGPLDSTTRFDFADGSYLLLVQDAILFDTGSSELSADGRATILQLASEIKASPHGRVWVRGHTDNVPIVKPATKQKYPHGNLQLSAARAIEVAAFLITQGGLSDAEVAVAGFGPSQPLRPNDSAENKRLNRRVEIYVAKPE